MSYTRELASSEARLLTGSLGVFAWFSLFNTAEFLSFYLSTLLFAASCCLFGVWLLLGGFSFVRRLVTPVNSAYVVVLTIEIGPRWISEALQSIKGLTSESYYLSCVLFGDKLIPFFKTKHF